MPQTRYLDLSQIRSHRVKKARHIISYTILGICFLAPLHASHLIGGYMQYSCLGPGEGASRNYQVTLTLLRDCAGAGAPFDNPISVGVYNKFNGEFFFARLAVLNQQSISQVIPANTCGMIPPTVCIETTTYQYLLENLPIINSDWLISWQRCCRPGDLVNIFDPGRTGSAIFTTISATAQQSCNSSPEFELESLPYILCAGSPLQLGVQATDVDGDSLVIRFGTAWAAGGIAGSAEMPDGDPFSCEGLLPDPIDCVPPFTGIEYVDPYFAEYPFAGDPPVSTDLIASTITGIADIQGRFLCGFVVSEYRNDTLIGMHPLELATLVTLCPEAPFSVNAEISPPSGPGLSDGSIVLEVSGGSPPYNFLWDSASSNTSVLDSVGVGDYSVTVTDALGCTWTDSFSVVLTDVLDITESESFRVFPNPWSDVLTIVSPEPITRTELFDTQGVLVYTGSTATLRGTGLVQGWYLLKVQTGTAVISTALFHSK